MGAGLGLSALPPNLVSAQAFVKTKPGPRGATSFLFLPVCLSYGGGPGKGRLYEEEGEKKTFGSDVSKWHPDAQQVFSKHLFWPGRRACCWRTIVREGNAALDVVAIWDRRLTSVKET